MAELGGASTQAILIEFASIFSLQAYPAVPLLGFGSFLDQPQLVRLKICRGEAL